MLTLNLVVFALMTIVIVYNLVSKEENKISRTLWYYGRNGVWTFFVMLYVIMFFVTAISICINL